MRDLLSQIKLSACHPELVARVQAAEDALARQGIYFRVACGLRTYTQSDADYAIGRTAPGTIITHARGGFSWHNFGCAVDCYPFLQGSNGNLCWSPQDERFQAMVRTLKSYGLAWGGDWHSIVDPPHFQLAELPATPTDEDRAALVHGGMQAVWDRYPHLLDTVQLQAAADLATLRHAAEAMFGLSVWRAAWAAAKFAWHVYRLRYHLARRGRRLLSKRAPAPNPQIEETMSEERHPPQITSDETDEGVELQANAFTDAMHSVGRGLKKAVGLTVTPDQQHATEQAVASFIGKDGVNLAVDAVDYVKSKFPGLGSVDLRNAAVAKFKADAAEAKKDLSALAGSTFNFIIEGALQIAISKGLEVATTAVLHANAEDAQ